MIIIEPHNIISREVTKDDIARIKEDAPQMFNLIYSPKYIVDPKRIKTGLALGHSQITKDDPLRFFVMRDGSVCTVKFSLIHNDSIIHAPEQKLSGQASQMFQHEIEHMEGKNIYENTR